MTVFDARYLAKGWLSVAHAAGKDKTHPVLCDTVHIELFGDGVRLVASDLHLLLHSWVPAVGKEDNPPPDLDEAPSATATAVDSDGRARGLLAYLRSMGDLADKDGGELVEAHLNLGIVEPDDVDGSFGFDAEWVTLEAVGRERLRLRVFDEPFPAWRTLTDGFKAARTSSIALNPEIVGRLAKVGKVLGNRPLVWQWGGTLKAASISFDGSEPQVDGLVMPIRVGTTPGDEEGGS